MADAARAAKREDKVEAELADMITKASAGPGVLDLMRLYDGAERVYASTIPETRVWVTSSTTGR